MYDEIHSFCVNNIIIYAKKKGIMCIKSEYNKKKGEMI